MACLHAARKRCRHIIAADYRDDGAHDRSCRTHFQYVHVRVPEQPFFAGEIVAWAEKVPPPRCNISYFVRKETEDARRTLDAGVTNAIVYAP